MKISFKCSVAHQVLLKFTKSWTVFALSWSEYVRSLIHPLIIFHCPLADLNAACLPSQDPLDCLQVVNFSRGLEKCWCHFCQGFCKFNRCSYLTIFLVLESNLIFQRSCLFKSNYWNEIREMPILKSIFRKSSLFGQRPNTRHSKYVILWLSCILKTKMTRCKIKMTFFMVLCVSFNLWSWVYLLEVCDEVIFSEFQGKQESQVKTRGFLKKWLLFFFSTNFISMRNNQ